MARYDADFSYKKAQEKGRGMREMRDFRKMAACVLDPHPTYPFRLAPSSTLTMYHISAGLNVAPRCTHFVPSPRACEQMWEGLGRGFR